MKKSFLFLFFVTCNLFALDDISIPYSFSPKDTIKASKFEANNSEIQTKFNKLNDSLELSFIRFSDLESGDSILEKCRIDTARIDHIRSNPEADSMTITKVDINGGTIDGTVIGANSAAAGTFTTVTASGAIVGSTINTGYGAHEIGQSNRTTDSPTFSGLTLNNNANFGNTITFTGTNKWIISNTAITDKTSSIVLGYPNTANSGFVVVREINHATSPGDVVLQAGGSNGVIYMSPRAYFGTRPANNHTWQLAFNDRFCLSADANWSLLTENLYYNSGWRRRKVASAAFLGFNGGNLSLQTVPSGPADTVISSPNQNIWSSISGNTAFGKNVFVGGYRVEVEGNALVNGTLDADSIKSTKGINCSTIKADSINSTKGINCSTINTGFGNFEIGQNLRTTDAVTFSKASADTFRASKRIVSDSIYTRVSKVDSIQIGTSNAFTLYDGWYKEGSFACTLKTSDVTVQKIGTAYYTKIGNQVTIKIPSLTGTSNSTDLFIHCGEMPSILTPSTGTYIAGSIGNIRLGVNIITGTFVIYNTGADKFIRIFKYDCSDFATSGTKGIDITSITYIN